MWSEGSLLSAVGVNARRSSYRVNMYPKTPTAKIRTAATAAIVPHGLGLVAVTTGRAPRAALVVLPLGMPDRSSLTMGLPPDRGVSVGRLGQDQVNLGYRTPP